MTVGLLVAAGSLKHFFPQKKKKEQTEGNREPNSGNAQQLGPLPVRQCGRFLGSTCRKGRSLVCLLTVSASKLKIYVLQRQFYVSIFFLWSKPLKIDQKKKNFPFAPFKRRPVKGQHFDSIGWGTDKSSHCWNQTKTSDYHWHFNASLIIRQSIRNENGASAWFAMKFGPLVMTS